ELARFRREADAVARLDHRNIVRIYQVIELAGNPCLVLEYVNGSTLAKKLDGEPQPPGWATAIVRDLAKAMDHAHQKGIVHRDLKPANVLLTADGVPKIADFGLAKHLSRDLSQEAATNQTASGSASVNPGSLTESGWIMGTPSYMAPEQASGDSK